MKLLFLVMMVCGYMVTLTKALDFYITRPVSSTVIQTNNDTIIRWLQLQSDGPDDLSSIIVDLMTGPSLNANAILNIATDLPTSTVFVTWIPPNSLGTSDQYFIRVTGVHPETPVVRYSARFLIQGSANATVPTIPTVAPKGSGTDPNVCPACIHSPDTNSNDLNMNRMLSLFPFVSAWIFIFAL